MYKAISHKETPLSQLSSKSKNRLDNNINNRGKPLSWFSTQSAERLPISEITTSHDSNFQFAIRDRTCQLVNMARESDATIVNHMAFYTCYFS